VVIEALEDVGAQEVVVLSGRHRMIC
jgi:hypothetical protein